MNCKNNFLNKKIWNLVDDWDFDKNFHIHRGKLLLSKTTNNLEKYCLLFPKKIPKFCNYNSFYVLK